MAYSPIPPLGQTTSAKSLPVTIANDQTTINVNIEGAAKGSTALGEITSTNQSADRQALDVQLRTSSGAAIDNIGYQLTVSNAIESTSFNLLASAYSTTTSISNDYILDHIEFHFNTTTSRDITVTLASGTKLYEATADTSLDLVLEDIEKSFNANENFTIAISQAVSALSVNVKAVVKQGEPIISGTDAAVILKGTTDAGNAKLIPVTPEGHVEVSIHGPRLPFGSVHVENIYPIFQNDAVYGLNTSAQSQLEANYSGSANVTATNSSFHLSLGTTIYSAASLQSRKRLRYRPGQGSIARFTALFSTPTASSYQLAGIGHAEDGLYFGYKNNDFGILYTNRGVRECRTLSITAAAAATETSYLVLNGVTNTVSINGNGNVAKTAYDIANSTYIGWKAEQYATATVLFVKNDAGAASGTYSMTSTSAGGTFSQTKAGAAATETFYTSTSWNGDPLNGTGESGFTIDPTKLNVYQIKIQYLGAGTLTFEVETTDTDGNNAEWVTVHTLKLPNTLTETSFGNPSFPFTSAVYSAGSTSNLVVKLGSIAGFIEGQKILQGNRFTYFNQLTSVGSTNYQALFSIRNSRFFGNRSNQSVINLLSITGAIKHTSPVTIYLIRNATLAGNPQFSQYSQTSVSTFDNQATTCTFTDNNQIVWTGTLGDTGNLEFSFEDEISLQPGEQITVAAKSSTGTPSYVIASINTREDQ